MEATFITLAIINALTWAFLAGELRRRAKQPAVLRALNRIGAGFLTGAGLLTAAVRLSD
jgi:threonine/homoserine/homoserine lactone efflux protein